MMLLPCFGGLWVKFPPKSRIPTMQESVSLDYVHGDKHVSPLERPVPADVETKARSHVAQANLDEASDLGFVVLHRCGLDFYFLIVCSWRGSNEIWETVYA